MFTVEAAKSNFFDRDAVKKRMSDAARKNLSKWGAFVRQDARSSLRYRIKPSVSPAPPSVHRTMQRPKVNKKTGAKTTQGVSPLREFLFFAWDESTRSVVSGPARLSGKLGNAPEATEYGGPSVVRSMVWSGGQQIRSTTPVNVKPRPFMRPAAARTNQKLPEIWANSITR